LAVASSSEWKLGSGKGEKREKRERKEGGKKGKVDETRLLAR